MNFLSSDTLYHIFKVGGLNLNDIFSLALTSKTMYNFIELRFKWKQFMIEKKLIKGNNTHLERRHCFDNLKYYLKSHCFICFTPKYHIPLQWKFYHKLTLKNLCFDCFQAIFGYQEMRCFTHQLYFQNFTNIVPQYLQKNNYFFYHNEILTNFVKDQVKSILIKLKYKKCDIRKYDLIKKIFNEIIPNPNLFQNYHDLVQNVKTRALKNILFENREWENAEDEN